VLDERERLLRGSFDYPDAWWAHVAKEVAGHEDAAVRDVVARLRRTP
jgi:hypothetical protein